MQNNNIQIITLDPSRWPEYKALRLRALKEDPQAFASKYEEQLAYSDDKWQKRIQEAVDGKSWLLFAQTDGELVGMAVGFQTPKDVQDKTANIASVFVVTEARGQGVAKKLMNELTNKIKSSDRVTKLKLEVNIDQTAALKLYESLEFVKVGQQDYLMGDGKTYAEYLMEKNI